MGLGGIVQALLLAFVSVTISTASMFHLFLLWRAFETTTFRRLVNTSVLAMIEARSSDELLTYDGVDEWVQDLRAQIMPPLCDYSVVVGVMIEGPQVAERNIRVLRADNEIHTVHALAEFNRVLQAVADKPMPVAHTRLRVAGRRGRRAIRRSGVKAAWPLLRHRLREMLERVSPVGLVTAVALIVVPEMLGADIRLESVYVAQLVVFTTLLLAHVIVLAWLTSETLTSISLLRYGEDPDRMRRSRKVLVGIVAATWLLGSVAIAFHLIPLGAREAAPLVFGDWWWRALLALVAFSFLVGTKSLWREGYSALRSLRPPQAIRARLWVLHGHEPAESGVDPQSTRLRKIGTAVLFTPLAVYIVVMCTIAIFKPETFDSNQPASDVSMPAFVVALAWLMVGLVMIGVLVHIAAVVARWREQRAREVRHRQAGQHVPQIRIGWWWLVVSAVFWTVYWSAFIYLVPRYVPSANDKDFDLSQYPVLMAMTLGGILGVVITMCAVALRIEVGHRRRNRRDQRLATEMRVVEQRRTPR
jgi:hypothetical protein